MEQLVQLFYEKYADTQTVTIRDFIHQIDWNNRLIGIKGSRGVGKTTLILQYIKLNYSPDYKVLYVSLDHFYFLEHRLYDLVDTFYKNGGEFIALDEVHRYQNWSVEIKNIYDNMPGLKIVFTGSSLLHINQAKADLSRRAVMYKMPGLSFREFLEFETGQDFQKYSIDEILNKHLEIAVSIKKSIKVIHHFNNYLSLGYYPFYLENKSSFRQKLLEVIMTVLEIDIPQYAHITTAHIIYLKKLLMIISRSAPFKPNMKNLSNRTGISLNTLKNYLKLLSDAELIKLLYVKQYGINSLNKPEKIFLHNTNLMQALVTDTDKGNMRETFFFNQVSVNYKVAASKTTDFVVNDIWEFEVGGKNKTRKQIAGNSNAFVVKDDIEIGYMNIIPLWLFGFLY